MKKIMLLSLALIFGLNHHAYAMKETTTNYYQTNTDLIGSKISLEDFETRALEKVETKSQNKIDLTQITTEKNALQLLKKEALTLKNLAQSIEKNQKRINTLEGGTVWNKITECYNSKHEPTTEDLAERYELKKQILKKRTLLTNSQLIIFELLKNNLIHDEKFNKEFKTLRNLLKENNKRAISAQNVSTVLSFSFEITKLILEGLVDKKVNPAKNAVKILALVLASSGIVLGIGQHYHWWDVSYFLYQNFSKVDIVKLIGNIIASYYGVSGKADTK
ncbi:MAG: hypothetical protein ABH827_01570 [bacterium]